MEKSKIEIFKLESLEPLILKPIKENLKAGGYGAFPSAALDFPDDSIDFLKLLVKNPMTTFPGRISGHSLNGLGIYDGDWCLIDKSLEANPFNLVAASIDDEFFIKRYRPKYNDSNKIKELKLESANPQYSDFDITDQTEFFLWGVITWTFKCWRKL